MYYDETEKPIGNVIIDIRRLTNLADAPISLAEAKTKLRVSFSDDDDEITALIPAAVQYVENFCNRSITYQRIRLIAYLENEYQLPYGPVIGLESVEQALSETGSGVTNYETSDADWKFDDGLFNPNACKRFRLTYTAGNYCPYDLKQAILEMIVFMYENRGKAPSQDEMMPILYKAQAYQNKLWT